MESCGERAEDVVTADVQADQGLAVEAVGKVRHVHTVQAAIGQLQALQWSVERTAEGKQRLKTIDLRKMKGR